MILVGSTSAKFLSAIAFDWFQSRKFSKLKKLAKLPRLDDKNSYVIILVTCYSEGKQSIQSTLDSLAQNDYSDKHKLLFVIADGDITGLGNDMSTPDICKSLIELRDDEEPDFMDYTSIGASQYNRAKVYSGYYKVNGHDVPMIFVQKCGSPQEIGQSKAGNRGKRDSQIILMNFLRRVTFDRPMSPLDFEMFEKIRKLTGVTANQYNLVLMVDADTLVKSDALEHMVDVMDSDAEIMGLCGDTRVANKSHSWVTMIQVFDYYLSNHLGKAFESTFGRVTCLPGCFSMYRVKAPKYGGFMVPLLASPDVIQEYSSGQVDTLHRKNLLLLGEDRFLTALMLRNFPNRKLVYAPKAICKTVVPDTFKVLLSQRRRWINSTIHNLLELLTAPQLCGIFCFSMQFIIFFDLLGTAILPSAFLILIYLVIAATALHQSVLLPILFLLLTFALQVGLVMLTTRDPRYVFWMVVYVMAIPVWNFVLPLYAFWNFDDFSWGATRQINGSDTGHGGNSEDEKVTLPVVTLKKWNEWATEKRD